MLMANSVQEIRLTTNMKTTGNVQMFVNVVGILFFSPRYETIVLLLCRHVKVKWTEGQIENFSYKPRAVLIECSWKNCETTAYSPVNQTIAPVPDYCSVNKAIMINQCHPRGRRKPFHGPAGCGPRALTSPDAL